MSAKGLIPASAGQTRFPRMDVIFARAHPRECGADYTPTHTAFVPPGSSPRVRGRRFASGLRDSLRRLIPASAGQTFGSAPTSQFCGAHPRECGADGHDVVDVLAPRGSSPRVRGRLDTTEVEVLVLGLIPASAGQTERKQRVCLLKGAHPRECGADSSSAHHRSSIPGSSPRVRGRLARISRRSVRVGLIPASAGQTSTTA